MSIKREVKSGDYARVVLEAPVKVVNQSGFIMEAGPAVLWRDAALKSIEKIAKPFKVGDVVPGSEVHRLPPETLVQARAGEGCRVFVGYGQVFFPGGSRVAFEGLLDDYKIVSLP